MKKTSVGPVDAMRSEYRREDLGKIVRGKYVKRLAKGSNLVLLEPEVAQAFPSSQAVNEALRELLVVARRHVRPAKRSSGTAKTGS